MRGQWRRTELSLTQVAFADAAVATPPAALQLAVEESEAAPAAVGRFRTQRFPIPHTPPYHRCGGTWRGNFCTFVGGSKSGPLRRPHSGWGD